MTNRLLGSQFGFKDCKAIRRAALLALVFLLIGDESLFQSSGILDEPLQQDFMTNCQFSAALAARNLVRQFERIRIFHDASFLFVCLNK